VVAVSLKEEDSGMALNIAGTPSFFVDGRPAPIEAFSQPDTAQQLRTFAEARAAEVANLGAKAFNFAAPEQVTKPDAKYVLTVKTTKGDVVIELDPSLAPTNVNSTVFLAQQGYFDGAPIALNDQQLGAVLMGNPTVAGNPGYQCEIEAKPGTMEQPGVVALFNSGANESGAQFILTYSPTKELDGRFSVIGQITSGLDIVKSLAAPQGDAKGDAIVSVTVQEKP
jgi:cyclophilin family peptidyl-prolyl cis-trans isomerase